MHRLAPTAKSVVGDNHVDIIVFHYRLHRLMVAPEVTQRSRKRSHHLENLGVRPTILWRESWKLYEFMVGKLFLKERQRTLVSSNYHFVTFAAQLLDDWNTTSCVT